MTGAYLAYFFNKMNKKLPPMGKGQPQVLYCGPSNKSVDVIAGKNSSSVEGGEGREGRTESDGRKVGMHLQ